MDAHHFDLAGRIALVTGSSQGIGLALAEGLAAYGAQVIVNGRDAAKVEAAVATLSDRHQGVKGVSFDVTDPQAVESGVARVEAEIGAIDILINKAGMQFRTALEDFPHDRWNQLLATNVSSVFYTAQAVAKTHDPPPPRGGSSTSPPYRRNWRGPVLRRTRRPRALSAT